MYVSIYRYTETFIINLPIYRDFIAVVTMRNDTFVGYKRLTNFVFKNKLLFDYKLH